MEPPTLEYATQRRPLFTIWQWLIVTYVCGALPLVVGVTTTLLYLITYERSLETIGVFIIATGLLIVAFGGVTWLIWVFKTRDFQSRRWWLRTAGALLLLLANFPACGLCVIAVGFWRFTVVNNAPTPMTVTIDSADTRARRSLGVIQPGARKRLYWRLSNEGDEIHVTAADDKGPNFGDFVVELNGTGAGANITITIWPDGTISTRVPVP